MSLRLPVLIFCASALGAAPAFADARWLAYDSAAPDQATVPRVEFGIPEADLITFAATCSGATRGVIGVALYVDIGQYAAGDQVTVTLSTPRFSESRPAAVVADDLGLHVAGQVARNDGIWEILMAEAESRIEIVGLPATEMPLNGSRVALMRFLAGCDRITAGDPAGGPVGPPAGGAPSPLAADGPLFNTGARAIPAYSSYRWGIALDPLPPGTTLTATGATGTVDGDAWLEVRADGTPPRTVWVTRADLAATPANTGLYINPEDAANLLIHTEAKPDAPVVGVIPPRATGIIDLGQRQGDWVLVRFGDSQGWVAHARLRPLLDPPPMMAVPGAPPAVPAPPMDDAPLYTQAYGAWMVDCDPCRGPAEGATCRIVAQSAATVRSRGTLAIDAPAVPLPGTIGDDKPPLGPLARYRTGAALPGPGDGASLTLAIDAADPVAVTGWVADPSGEAALILPSALAPLMEGLRGGQTVMLTVSDGTRSWADRFDLAGFAAAFADMSGRLPYPTRYYDPTACPPAGTAAPAEGGDPAAEPEPSPGSGDPGAAAPT